MICDYVLPNIWIDASENLGYFTYEGRLKLFLAHHTKEQLTNFRVHIRDNIYRIITSFISLYTKCNLFVFFMRVSYAL